MTNFIDSIVDESIDRLHKVTDEYATALNNFKAVRAYFEVQSKKRNEMEQKLQKFERELDDIVQNRFENNDVLIKVHKEIMDQNSKVERARRELKIAKKAMMKRIDDREYVHILEVRCNNGIII